MSAIDLLRAIATTTNLPGAACARAENRAAFDRCLEKGAKACAYESPITVCSTCPALLACRSWVRELPPRKRPLGVTRGAHPPEPATMRALGTYPSAAVVGVRTDGLKVTQVRVRCMYCGSVHTHLWHDETDGLRAASCTPYGAIYRITIDSRTKLEAMRAQYPTPDGVVGLVPLHLSYCFEIDGPDEDVVGIVLETTVGKFAVWLPLESTVGLAGQLVHIAENREDPVCTSRRWPICSGTPASRSQVTSTATRRMRPRARLSMG